MAPDAGEQRVVGDRMFAASQKSDEQIGRPDTIPWFAQENRRFITSRGNGDDAALCGPKGAAPQPHCRSENLVGIVCVAELGRKTPQPFRDLVGQTIRDNTGGTCLGQRPPGVCLRSSRF
jgi:hypothetical protein